jgi:DNA polymerase elongation subunit (family B)
MKTKQKAKVIVPLSDDKYNVIQNFLVLDKNENSYKLIHEDLLGIDNVEQWVDKSKVIIQPIDGDVKADDNRKVCKIVDGNVIVDENKLKIFDRTSKLIPDWKPTKTLKPFKDVYKTYIDIETLGLDPEKDRIIYIGLKCSITGKYFLITDKDEKKLLEKFVKWLKNNKPEILSGYNSLQFDIPFIIKRCEILGVKQPFKTSDYRITVKTAQVFGEAISFQSCYLYGVDLIDIYHQVLILDNVKRVLTSHTLKQSVIQMGLRKEQRLELDYKEIQECWKNGDLEKIEEYLKYDLDDTELLTDFLLPSVYYQQLFVPGMNVQKLATTGNGTKWQAVLEDLYPEIGKGVIESDPKCKYVGGYTVGYSGLHRNTSKVDVSSLYPSIMLVYGITSYKDKDYKLLGIIKYLLEERLRLKGIAKTDPEANQMQGALKVLLNSAYGSLSTNGIAFNDYIAAALVTAYGRRIAKLMVDCIEKEDGKIVEVDTDGVMFSCLSGKNQKIFEFVRDNLPTGIGMEHEWQAKALYIPSVDNDLEIGLRKNYIIFHQNGKVKATGKFRKRDICKLEQNFVIDYLKNYLESPDDAEKYFKDNLDLIISGNYDIEKLTIRRKIRKREIELLKLGKTGDVISFYETDKGKGVEGEYSISYYQDKIKELRNEILTVIDTDLLSKSQSIVDDSFIDNNTVQLSLFS